MERDTFSIFVDGFVFHRSLDFSRGIPLSIFEKQKQKACNFLKKKSCPKFYLLQGLLENQPSARIFLGLGHQQRISISWSPVRKTSFFFFFLLELRVMKLMISEILQMLILL
jgi:hypothetical protein